MALSTRSVTLPSALSTGSVPDDFVAPAYLSIPDEYDPNRTLGPYVAAIATLAGFPPDPEQQLLLDVSFALDKRGKPLIFESVIIAPRQNLKTGYLKQKALGLLFVLHRELTVWSAHEFDTSRRALIDLEKMIEGSDKLLSQVKLTSRGQVATHGAVPEITLKPDKKRNLGPATLAFKTRTSGGGRGLTGDDLFVDEAYAAQGDQMGAVMPIMLARPESQVEFASSACRPESAYLWDLVLRGRAGGGPRMLYAEWCAPPPEEVCDSGIACTHAKDAKGCGCDKPEVIRLAHPAVTRGRILLEKVADLRRTMPAEEFPREIMGWHNEPDPNGSPMTIEHWNGRCDAASKVLAPVALAIDVTPGLETSSMGVAGRRDDAAGHVELIDRRPGTDWLVDRIDEVAANRRPCVLMLDPASPAGMLEKTLLERGWVIEKDPQVQVEKRLHLMTAREYAQACGSLADDVLNGRLFHIGQEPLDDAVKAAGTRPLAGAWAWSRTTSSADISPLVAITNARFGHAIYGVTTPPEPFFIR